MPGKFLLHSTVDVSPFPLQTGALTPRYFFACSRNDRDRPSPAARNRSTAKCNANKRSLTSNGKLAGIEAIVTGVHTADPVRPSKEDGVVRPIFSLPFPFKADSRFFARLVQLYGSHYEINAPAPPAGSRILSRVYARARPVVFTVTLIYLRLRFKRT